MDDGPESLNSDPNDQFHGSEGSGTDSPSHFDDAVASQLVASSLKDGHTYSQQHITGGSVQFGDVYNITHRASSSHRRLKGSAGRQNDPSSRSKPVFVLPRSSTSCFTGRRLQLEQLQFTLNQTSRNECKRKTTVIVGLGGSGKTQFCLKYAEENQQRYWGVFWIDASSRETADHGYAGIGTILGKGSSAAAGKWFLSQTERPWLLILDNADSQELDVSSLIPTGDNGHVLITTRNRNLVSHTTTEIIRLNLMDPDDAINLLLSTAYPDDPAFRSEDSYRLIARNIAERLGFLAIAVRHAGTTIQRKIYTLEKYLSSYLGHRGSLLSGRSIMDVEADVIATWEIPFRRLETKETCAYQDAVALIHVFAFFHHEAIPVSVLQAAWKYTGRSLLPAVKLPEIFLPKNESLDLSEARLRFALNILYDYSILEFDALNGVCSLHPVIHTWARSRIRNSDTISYWIRCTAFILACSGYHHPTSDNRGSLASLLPHVDAFLRHLETYELAFIQNTTEARQLEHIAKIFEKCGQWKQSLRLLNLVLSHMESTLGRQHDETLEVKRAASLCHWNLFEVRKALQIQNEIRSIRFFSRPSLFDWIHPIKPMYTKYLLSLSDLTQTLWLAGLRDLSKMAGERAVSGLSRTLGEEHLLTLEASFNLGRTYRHIGRLEEGHKLLTFVLRQRKRVLGPDHLDTLMVKNEVGMSLCARKVRLSVAERLVRSVWEARKLQLGEEHAYTLWSVNDLAKVLLARGSASTAAQLLQDIIPAVARTLGEDHAGMIMTKGNLARAFGQTGRWHEAEELLKNIIRGLEEKSPDHPDCVWAQVGLARIQIRMENYDEAEKGCKSVISRMSDQKKQADGAKNITAAAAGLLAEIYIRRDDKTSLSVLRDKHRTLDENALDRPFETL